MPDNRFIGNAQDVANKWTITVSGVWAAGDTATITINGKSLIVTIGALVTIADVIDAIVAAFNGDGAIGTEVRNTTGNLIGEMAGITAAEATATTITLIGKTPGEPHVITVSEVTAGSGALAIAESTAASGRSWWSVAANWSLAAVPVNGDTVYYDNTDTPILYGLAQSAVTLAALIIRDLQPGAGIGLKKEADGDYAEYRAAELAIGASILTIDDSNANRIKINLGTVQSAIEILNTGFGENGMPAVQLRGTHASNTFETHGGLIGYAYYGGEAGDMATYRNTGATVIFGPGMGTIETYQQSDGETALQCNITTATQTGGTTTHRGAGTVTTLTMTGGQWNDSSSGTYTTVTFSDSVFDASGDLSPQTITTMNMNRGASLVDVNRLTITNLVKGTAVQRLEAA